VTTEAPPPAVRPGLLVLVSGTGTDIGKTWFAAATTRALRAAGVPVALRKPVQSGEPGAATDAEALAVASGEDPVEVTPPHRTLEVAWAPPMAADILGLAPFTVADLVAETTWPPSVARGVGMVEAVGGPRSPLASDGDTVALAAALRPDVVVVVADAGLGTVNAVRLSVGVLDAHRVVVALNRYGDDPLHARNLAWLRSDGLTVVTSPPELATTLQTMLKRRGWST
jgi:dethiobiotin synthetase